jgi:transcriptional regulator with XRE-family HTH domain
MQSTKLGGRIRTFRDRQEISREELAQRSGLDTSFIQAVEEEDLYPALGPLLKLARGLGVRLGTFLDDEQGSEPLIVRAADRREELATHQARGKPASLRFFSLGRGKPDRHMEPFSIQVMPEEGSEQPLSSHEGEEFIVVLSGEIEVLYGQEQFVLAAGDSIYLNSVVPHRVSCHGAAEAWIYAVLYFPE